MASECVSTTTLPNGVRVVSEYAPHVDSVAIGVWVDTGSRYEAPSERGITHFIEHMLFKGTERRTARDIALEVESRGGHLNAFTDKEYTCYYARALSEHAPIVIDVLGDMVGSSLLDPEEIAREQNVVVEEIRRADDAPEDTVHELFARAVWPTHALGRPILGSARTVRSLTRESLVRYLSSHYGPHSLVIAAAGNVEHAAVLDLAAQHFGDRSGQRPRRTRRSPEAVSTERRKRKRTEQVHFCMGGPSCRQDDDDRYPLTILDMVLGGNMSSRLFQEIREKRGLAYSIGSFLTSYRDSGLFTIYGGTSPATFEEVLRLVRAELAGVRGDGLVEDEISKAKTQIRGALVLGLESMSNRMMRLGKSTLYHGRVVPMEEIVQRVRDVTPDDIVRVARQFLDDSRLSLAAIGPFGRSEVRI